MNKTQRLYELFHRLRVDNITRGLLSSDGLFSVLLLFMTLGALLTGNTMHAQNLALEGETGVFATPLAYAAPSPPKSLGNPVLGFHFIDHGRVVGTFSEVSITEGAFDRLEFGYTRNVHSTGGDARLSPLWHSGFNIVHAKVNIVREDTGTHNWIPAISVGFMLRTQVHNVGGAIANHDTNNGDVYAVATKTITESKLPILLSAGVRGTNAELWGIAGNASRFQGRAFGALGFQFKGPFKSTFVLASEVAQQPRHPEGLPAAVIPTTMTYAARVVPFAERKFNVDAGVAQIANHIMPGVGLRSRHLFAMGISYAF